MKNIVKMVGIVLLGAYLNAGVTDIREYSPEDIKDNKQYMNLTDYKSVRCSFSGTYNLETDKTKDFEIDDMYKKEYEILNHGMSIKDTDTLYVYNSEFREKEELTLANDEKVIFLSSPKKVGVKTLYFDIMILDRPVENQSTGTIGSCVADLYTAKYPQNKQK